MKVFDRIITALARKRLLSQEQPEFPLVDCRTILAISNTAIGDTLFSVPGLKALRALYPASIIELAVDRKYLGLFKDVNGVNRTWASPKSAPALLRTWAYLKQRRFEAVVIFHESFPRLESVAVLAGLRPIVNAYARPAGRQHAIEQRLDAVRLLSGSKIEAPRMTIEIRAAQRERAQQLWEARGLSAPMIAICPGGSRQYKQWPVEKWTALAGRILRERRELKILILGSRGESGPAKRIIQGVGQPDRVIDLCGKLKIEKLPAVIQACRLLISNDTGPLHLAVAVGTRTISLFVPTRPWGTGPYQDLDKHLVVHKDRPCGEECVTKRCPYLPSCMDLISVDEVFAAFQRHFQR